MKKGFQLPFGFFLLFGVFGVLSMLSPVKAETIGGLQPSLWLKPQPSVNGSCGVATGFVGILKRNKIDWKDCSGKRNDASGENSPIWSNNIPEYSSTAELGFHPTMVFGAKNHKLEGKPGNYLSLFAVRSIARGNGKHAFFQYRAIWETPLYFKTLNDRLEYASSPLLEKSWGGGYTDDKNNNYANDYRVNGADKNDFALGAHLVSASIHHVGRDTGKYAYWLGDNGSDVGMDNGDTISEIIAFPSKITDPAKIQKVESYLAIKYGLTLATDYSDPDGSPIFERGNYTKHIFGLGKDTRSTLDQRIATSVDSKNLIVSTDTDFSKLNDQHNSINLGKAYLLFGDNGKAYKNFTKEGLSSASFQYYPLRSEKIWKVQNTNFTQSVNLQFDAPFTGLRNPTDKYVLLLSDNETDFSAKTSPATGEVQGGKLIFKNVKFSEGTHYMTVAIRDMTPPQKPEWKADMQTVFSGTLPLSSMLTSAIISDNDGGVGLSGFLLEIKKSDNNVVFSTGMKNLQDISLPPVSDSFPDGKYILVITALDKADNKSMSDGSKEIIIDRTAPTISGVSTGTLRVNDGKWDSFSIPTATFDDNLTGLQVVGWIQTTTTKKPDTQQDFIIVYTAQDGAGNTATLSTPVRINFKPEKPNVTVDIKSAGKDHPHFTFTFEDATWGLKTATAHLYAEKETESIAQKTFDLEKKVNEKVEKKWSPTFTSSAQYYRIELEVEDLGGLTSEKTILYYPPTVNFDKTGPLYTNQNTYSDLKVLVWSPNPVSSLSYSGYDGINTLNQIFNPASDCKTSECSFTPEFTFPATGSYTITAFAKDSVATGTNDIKIIYDNTAPADPVFTKPNEKIWQKSDALSFEWKNLFDQGDAGLSGVYYSLKKGEAVLETGILALDSTSFSKEIMEDGDYTLTLYTEDKAGNRSEDTTSLIIHRDTTPPNPLTNLSGSFDPSSATLSFSWDETEDNDGGIGLSGYEWTLTKGGDHFSGGKIKAGEKLNISFDKIDKKNRSYTLSVQAVDKLGNKTAAQKFSVTVKLINAKFVLGDHIAYDDGTKEKRQKIFSGASLQDADIPDTLMYDTGWVFDRWEPTPDTTSVLSDDIVYTASAKKDLNQRVTITFDTQGGEQLETKEVLKNIKVKDAGFSNPSKAGYTFKGRSLASNDMKIIDGDETVEDLGKTTLYAVREEDPAQRISLELNLQGGVLKGDQTKKLLKGTEFSDALLEIPTKTGHVFSGWSYTGEDILKNGDALDKSGMLYAHWDAKEYRISFNTDGGTSIDAITGKYDTKLSIPTSPTKTGYTFDGWEPKFPDKMPAENIELKAKWRKETTSSTTGNGAGSSHGYSGGGGAILTQPSKDQSDNTTKVEKNTAQNNEDENVKKNQIQYPDSELYNPSIEDGYCFKRKTEVTISPSTKIVTNKEFEKALSFLYSYEMTRFNEVDAFDPYRYLSRQEAAKMFSNFAMHVLCRKPDTGLSIHYDDIENADPTLKEYITLSYQLGLMKGSGQGDGVFRPFDTISKAEFNAVLIRMILKGYLNENNLEYWYENYNKTSTQLSIIHQGAGQESIPRIYATLMLFRAYKEQLFSLQDIDGISFILQSRSKFIP